MRPGRWHSGHKAELPYDREVLGSIPTNFFSGELAPLKIIMCQRTQLVMGNNVTSDWLFWPSLNKPCNKKNGRGPLLRLSRVSTFLRLDKLGCFEICRDSGKSKLSGLVASLECRLFHLFET